MSGIAGIYSFNGAPLDRRILAALAVGLARRGPDGGSEYRSERLGMAYRAFHTTKESRCEMPPFKSPQGHVLCWDGRLDSRENLISVLEDDLDGDLTDHAIVMRAYLRWGQSFLEKLVGDFALSLWDPNSSTLLLARDPFGTRPLYYHASAAGIIWSSDLLSLVQLELSPLEIEDEYIAGFLALFPDPGRTPYRGIHAVEPAHVVAVRHGELQSRWFWKPDPALEIRYKHDSDYEDHFRQLFWEALRCRLRVDGTVWAGLSGGLDSSSIVCVADRIMSSETTQAARLETFSLLNDRSETYKDGKFIRCVEDHLGRTGFHIPEDDCWMDLPSLDVPYLSMPSTLTCVSARHEKLRKAMRLSGVRVLLNGLGGDQLLWSVPEPSAPLADLVWRGRLWQLPAAIRKWNRVLRVPYLHLIRDGVVMPFLPHRVRQFWRRRGAGAVSLLNREFAASMKFDDRLGLPPDPFGFRQPSQKVQSAMLLSVIHLVSIGDYSERGDIELRYPFLDRRLVEFMLAIPLEQKQRPGSTRSLMRRTLRGVLPEDVRRRQDKGSVSEAMYRGLSSNWPKLKQLFDDPRVCNMGYIDSSALKPALERARHGMAENDSVLVRTISLEVWLRSIENVCRSNSVGAAAGSMG
jgi:asparagine synthase (glutamine-hydrolysing)